MQVRWKTGIVVRMRVEAGVIAERTFAPPLARLDVALQHDLRVGRDLEIDRHALDELDALPTQESGEHQLVETFGHRRRRRIVSAGSGPSATATGQALAEPLGDAMMLRAALVPLPVHARRSTVEHLHPIRADVARRRSPGPS